MISSDRKRFYHQESSRWFEIRRSKVEMRPIVYTKNTDESVSCEWGQSGVDFHTSSLNATIDEKERQAAHTKRKERKKSF